MLQERRVCLAFALGCPRSESDSTMLGRYFRANGWQLTERVEDAELVVLSGCGVDAESERVSLAYQRHVRRRMRPGARLFSVGCMAGIRPDLLGQGGSDACLPPKSIHEIDRLIEASVPLAGIAPANHVQEELRPLREVFDPARRRRIEWLARGPLAGRLRRKLSRGRGKRNPIHEYDDFLSIRVAWGCLEECSYCGIRFATGTLKSRPLEEILGEFDRGLDEGARNFRLLGDDVGAWGRDQGADLHVLLEALFSRQGDFRLLWDDCCPNWLIGDYGRLAPLIEAEAGRIGHLGFPIQSGSDRVLERMRRRYRRADLKRCLGGLLERAPGLRLSTHVLVGFPGETEEDFEQTLDLLAGIPFHHILCFRYCERPHTAARELPGCVPQSRIESRIRRLRRCFPDNSRE